MGNRFITQETPAAAAECRECSFRDYTPHARSQAAMHVTRSQHAVTIIQEKIMFPLPAAMSDAEEVASRPRKKPSRAARRPAGREAPYDSMDELIRSRKRLPAPVLPLLLQLPLAVPPGADHDDDGSPQQGGHAQDKGDDQDDGADAAGLDHGSPAWKAR